VLPSAWPADSSCFLRVAAAFDETIPHRVARLRGMAIFDDEGQVFVFSKEQMATSSSEVAHEVIFTEFNRSS
jgi:hypothetical protein